VAQTVVSAAETPASRASSMNGATKGRRSRPVSRSTTGRVLAMVRAASPSAAT
jgi:hypothetical protein